METLPGRHGINGRHPTPRKPGRHRIENTMQENNAKKLAKALRKELAAQGIETSHSKCLEIASRLAGEKSYQHLKANRENQEGNSATPPSPSPDWGSKAMEGWVGKASKETSPGDEAYIPARQITLHQFLVTVLTEEHDRQPREYYPTMDQAAHDISEGDCIGDFEKIGSMPLDPKTVPAILRAIGNDGSYFEHEMEG